MRFRLVKMDAWKLVLCLYGSILLSVCAQNCSPGCVCESGSVCTECQKWHIYKVENGTANCNSTISSIQFTEVPTLTATSSNGLSFSIKFTRHDLPIAEDSVNYYFYSLLSKQAGNASSFQTDGTFVQHLNWENPQQITMTLPDLTVGASYEVKLGLYRRVVYRGWEEIMDSSEPINVTTKDVVWSPHNGYEYMSSASNGYPIVDFTEASTICQALGANLASITSHDEHQLLGVGWIGLYLPDEVTDMSDCGHCDNCYSASDKEDNEYCKRCIRCRALWRWTDGSDLGFTNWYERDPDSTSSAYRCVFKSTAWLQYSCTLKRPFICKRASGSENCPVNCECKGSGECLSCVRWYLYRVEGGQGKCYSYVATLTFQKEPILTAVESETEEVVVQFTQYDLPVASNLSQYYYYGLVWRKFSSGSSFQESSTFVQHQNVGNPQQITMTLSGLQAGTSYEVKLGLYRRVVYRGWKEIMDSSEPINIHTTEIVWHRHAGFEYMASTMNGLERLNFSQASSYCQKIESNLTSIVSQNELEFLGTLLASYSWIGLYLPSEVTDMSDCGYCDNCASASNKEDNEYCKACIRCRSQWRWTDGSAVGFTHWDERDPDSVSTAHRCAYMSSFKYAWHQTSCSSMHNFICQRASIDCPANCECHGAKTCISCDKWFVYRMVDGQGSCDLYVGNVQFNKKPKLAAINIEKTSFDIEMPVPDVAIPRESQEYYMFSLQYKLLQETEDMYQNTGRFAHSITHMDQFVFSATSLAPGTEYELRVALYRRLEVKGWQELLDATDSVTVTTLEAGWRVWGGSEYLFSFDNDIQAMDFTSAENFCGQYSAHLITIEDSAEEKFLSNHFQSNTWIGLVLPGTESTFGCDMCDDCSSAENKSTSSYCGLCQHCRAKWQWVDGSPVRFSAWHQDQPSGNNRCAYSKSYNWYNVQCTNTRQFGCKRALSGSALTIGPSTTPFDGMAPEDLKKPMAETDSDFQINNSVTIGVMAGLAFVVVIAVIVGIVLFHLLYRQQDKRNNQVAFNLQKRHNGNRRSHVYENHVMARYGPARVGPSIVPSLYTW